jgi:hypothetical protein
MSSTERETSPCSVFGVPTVLTSIECSTLISDLTTLWVACYSQQISELESDINRCRHFFDPVARGQSLRSRLYEVAPAPTEVVERIARYGPPLVIDAGEGVLLVGVEARLLIDLLTSHRKGRGHIVLPNTAVSTAERVALRTYRRWTLGRLTQVIALRAGQGKEPMQPIAVGIVLSLLVNRSTTPSRAVTQRDHDTAGGRDVDTAIYAGAEAFATSLNPDRRGRSSGEQRLKGGYGLTEARRRLAHRLTIIASNKPDEKLIYIPARDVEDVVAFLGADLARRSSLTAIKLQDAFEDLVTAFRGSAQTLAYQAMVFDRKAETNDLKKRLLESFSKARAGTGRSG